MFVKKVQKSSEDSRDGDVQIESLSLIHGIEVTRVIQIANSCGCFCSFKAKIRGGSGKEHEFDFVGRKGRIKFVISCFELKSIRDDEIEMIRLRVKTLDSSPMTCIVLLLSKLPDNLRKMASDYHYLIVEPSPEKDAYSNLQSRLQNID